jgi:hypothetical protein
VGTDPSSGGLCAVQGVLARVAPRPLGERRALAAPLLHRLRGCIDDESVPTPQRAQMGAVLAALGEPADRARWIEAFSAPARPDDRIVARTALVAVEGPGAGAELVESARRHARSDAGAELLAVVGSWARDHAAALPPGELDACSALLETIAADEATTSVSRTRALSALRVLDAPRASARALQWLADPQTDPARFASACLGVRDGDVDADRAAALLGDPALSEARRMDVATALAARANGERETDAARTRAVDTALELLARSADPEVRRRAASLAGTATRPEDRSSCARLASSDPDAGVRAAARSALARAERRRPRRRGVRLREPRRRSSRSSG